MKKERELLDEAKMRDEALVTDHFWDESWKGVALPVIIDTRVQWQFGLAQVFQRFLPRDNSKHLFEVGCAPGRWLVWFSREMGYHVSGCDSSPRGVRLTIDNLRINGVDGKVYQADLLRDHLPIHAFDVVVSLGVIEHFRDPKAIVARHLELLKPRGTIVFEVPNMAGWLNSKLLELAGMQDLVRGHNLRIMHCDYFESIARDFGLSIRFLSYVGGFDLGMIVHNHDSRKHGRRPIMYPLWMIQRIFRVFPRLPQRLINFNGATYSNMLVCILSNAP